jgi:hypothetical protein
MLLADHLCYLAARLPLQIYVSSGAVTVGVDGHALSATLPQAPTAARLVSGSAIRREYQIDGTDSTNNFTEDDTALATLAATPYYQFQAWMRDNATYSTWTDVVVADPRTGRALTHLAAVPTGQAVTLPLHGVVMLTADLERPESPVAIELLAGEETLATVNLDRNDRFVTLSTTSPSQSSSAFFPQQARPFAAEVADAIVRTGIWALLLLGATTALSCAAALVAALLVESRSVRRWATTALGARWTTLRAGVEPTSLQSRLTWLTTSPGMRWRRSRQVRAAAKAQAPSDGGPRPTQNRALRHHWERGLAWGRGLHPADRLAAAMVLGSFAFVIYIALAQYHALPHILDASAYYFQAKIFASGRLSAPAPPPAELPAFQGPFMVIWNGRWFAQYPPATPALLALGMLLHVPWMIEPVLASAALLGIYRIGRRMFDPWTAVLAVLLLALSPFYSYLAAAYLSHAIALFAEVFFLLFLLHFVDHRRTRDLVIAAAALALLFAARELTAVIVGVVVVAWMVVWHGRALWRHRRRTVPAVLVGIATLWVGLLVYLLYNGLQTGNPFLLPRTIFSPSDRYGFGIGVGFYGRHTLAAGLLNLDEQFTSLLIDLFGWPFYLTLALVPLALLHRDTGRRWDWFNLLLFAVVTASQIGFYYHGIYLGPRYLYVVLPFVALLVARGVTAVAAACRQAIGAVLPWIEGGGDTVAAHVAVGAVLGGLVLCNLMFYMPRQLAQHRNFTGLPVTQPVDVATLYALHPHHALVITTDWALYNYVLWPLNDPDLRGDVIYALARSPADTAMLRAEFPDRALYDVIVDAGGRVLLVPASP